MSALDDLIADLKSQADNPNIASWIRITLRSSSVVCQQLQLAKLQIQQNTDELRRENERLNFVRNQEQFMRNHDEFMRSHDEFMKKQDNIAWSHENYLKMEGKRRTSDSYITNEEQFTNTQDYYTRSIDSTIDDLDNHKTIYDNDLDISYGRSIDATISSIEKFIKSNRVSNLSSTDNLVANDDITTSSVMQSDAATNGSACKYIKADISAPTYTDDHKRNDDIISYTDNYENYNSNLGSEDIGLHSSDNYPRSEDFPISSLVIDPYIGIDDRIIDSHESYMRGEDTSIGHDSYLNTEDAFSYREDFSRDDADRPSILDDLTDIEGLNY